MMKGFIIQQQQEVVVEENMSNLTCASGEANVSSGNRAETGTIYPQQYFSSPNQPQPAAVKKKRNLPGNPDPDAEVIALSPKTLMATNRFLCEICNKGFQRDQNLQLHRRGHNLPWKLKQRSSKEIRKKVYVCPEASCVHHDPSRALGDLTGIKKHFCRKHGEKKWKCDKCSKRYAVQSDWKAHSKTCGTREYRCDCGTLFSRRDSFITHRAFCDALAEESARGAIPTNPLLTSQQPAGTSTSHMNLPPQFNMSHDFHAFSMKKEQQHFTSVRPEVPPWLAAGPPPPPPPPIDLSSSIFTTTRLDQDLRVHENPINPPIVGPTLPPYHPTPPSPHMSATALLQKAAQMGASMSKTCSSRPHPAHVSANSDSSANNTSGFALNLSSRDQELATSSGFVHGLTPPFGNKAALPSALTDHHVSAAATAGAGAPPSSLLQDMMNSLSAGTGFEGTPFEDAFGGIWSTKNKDVNFHETLAKTTTTHHSKTDEGGTGGGGGGNDGLTRDFLGLRALSHSDILNIAGLGNCINTSHEHHNHNQKSWQG